VPNANVPSTITLVVSEDVAVVLRSSTMVTRRLQSLRLDRASKLWLILTGL
jgi:hypothetical protein